MVVFATNAQGHTVVIVASSPEVLDELRELGLITSRDPGIAEGELIMLEADDQPIPG